MTPGESSPTSPTSRRDSNASTATERGESEMPKGRSGQDYFDPAAVPSVHQSPMRPGEQPTSPETVSRATTQSSDPLAQASSRGIPSKDLSSRGEESSIQVTKRRTGPTQAGSGRFANRSTSSGTARSVLGGDAARTGSWRGKRSPGTGNFSVGGRGSTRAASGTAPAYGAGGTDVRGLLDEIRIDGRAYVANGAAGRPPY